MAIGRTERAVLVASGILGALLYALLVAWQPDPDAAPFFGTRIYDHYFLALTQGQLDIPLRIASIEGHYDTEGRAFVYHGFGPLVYRAVLWPFVDLLEVPVHLISIWTSAVVGTVLYHIALVRAVGAQRLPVSVALALVVWITAPGVLLVTNGSLFQEPAAFGYMASGSFVLVLTGFVYGRRSAVSCLIPLAIAAALMLFARPHLAIGLYLGCSLVGLLALWGGFRQALGRSIGAILILGCAGVAVLAVNDLRSGSAFQAHGGFGEGKFEQGGIYWGDAKGESPYNVTFKEHGRFNTNRILPNLMMYGAVAAPYVDWMTGLWREWTASSGVARLEGPLIGFGFLWVPWLLLILLAGGRFAPNTRHAWILLLATIVGALLMLSYPTITLRYRIDLWPFVAGVAILCAGRLSANGSIGRPTTLATLGLSTAMSVLVLSSTLTFNKGMLRELGLFAEWSRVTCEQQATRKGFAPKRIADLCRYPAEPGHRD